jgi:hypothetical protein
MPGPASQWSLCTPSVLTLQQPYTLNKINKVNWSGCLKYCNSFDICKSHITADNEAPIWDPRPIFLSPSDFLLDSFCLLCCSALSDERTGL